MRAFNSRKLSKQTRLFFTKGKRINNTSTNEYGDTKSYDLKITRDNKNVFITTAYSMFSFHNKHVLKTTKLWGVGTRIRNFEKLHNLKIEDIGLTRNDFSNKNYSENFLTKIYKAVKANRF